MLTGIKLAEIYKKHYIEHPIYEWNPAKTIHWENMAKEINGLFERPNDRTATCEWKEESLMDGDPYYETSCDNTYAMVDGTFENNGYKHCPGCGGKISRADL